MKNLTSIIVALLLVPVITACSSAPNQQNSHEAYLKDIAHRGELTNHTPVSFDTLEIYEPWLRTEKAKEISDYNK